MSAKTCTSRPLPRLIMEFALCSALGSLLLPTAAHGQAAQGSADQVAASMERAKSGSFSNADIKTIAKAGVAEEAIPALEEQFARSDDVTRQGIIASGLIRLGDSSNVYWDFLLQQATLAIDSDLPDPFRDSRGNATGQQPSPELLAWTQAHHVDVSTAVESWTYDLPGKVLQLSMTGDQRSVALLRHALQSRNPFIVMMAAQGLAQVQDKESIPLIIEACRRFDKGMAGGIAQTALVFFDDPRAQAAVDTYVPEDLAKIRRDARAHGMKPFGY